MPSKAQDPKKMLSTLPPSTTELEVRMSYIFEQGKSFQSQTLLSKVD